VSVPGKEVVTQPIV